MFRVAYLPGVNRLTLRLQSRKDSPMQKLFFTTALLLAPVTYALELNDVLSHVATANPTVQQAKAAWQKSQKQRQQNFGSYLPTLTANGELADQDITTNGVGVDSQPTTYGITLEQTLFNGGARLASYRQSQNTERAQLAAYQNTLQQQLVAAVFAYSNLLAAQETVAAEQTQVAVLKQRLDETQVRLEADAATQTDLSQAEARLAAAQATLAQAQADLVRAETTLQAVYGELGETHQNAMAWPTTPSITLVQADAGVVEKALGIHPQVQQAVATLAAERYAVKNARGTYFPELTASATWQQMDSEATDTETEMVALNASWELFDGFKNQRGVQAALKGQEGARYALEVAQRNVRADVLAYAAAWHSAQLSVASFEASLKAAQLARDGMQREFELGSRKLLDLLDAEQEVRDTRVSLVRARADALTAAYNYWAAQGTLHREFIGE